MIDAVFAAVIYAAGGVILVEPTAMTALACEERKVEIMQTTDAVCIDLNGVFELLEYGFVVTRFEPSLEGEL